MIPDPKTRTESAPQRPASPRSPGEAPLRLIRSRKSSISIRWIVTLAAAALITAAVLSVGAVSEHNMRNALTRELEARLLLEARNLALTSTEALLADFPELALHPLAKEMKARQPELEMILVVDHGGVVQGDPDAHRLGSTYVPDPRLEPIESTQALGPGETMLGDRELLVAVSPVSHRDGRLIGSAMVGMRRDYLDRLLVRARQQQMLVLGVVLVLGIALAFVLMSFVLRPVNALRTGIERIGRGDLDHPLGLNDRTELGFLADAVDDMALALKHAQAEMVERERLTREVELARQIQTSLLPNRGLTMGHFTIAGSQRAAAEVGGDYFDYFHLPGGRVGIAVADVAGKGLGGCLVMSMLSALLRAYRNSFDSPSELLATLDERLSETLQPGSFVTMFYAVLDPATGSLVHASAGHSPLLIYRRDRGAVEWFKTTGIPLGAVRGGVIRRTLKDATLKLAPGDLMVQFTDGINEAFAPEGEVQFGFERMEQVVTESAARGCEGVISSLHRAVEEWTRNGPAMDDETVLVVSHAAPAEAAVPGAEPSILALPQSEPLRFLADARARGQCLELPASLDAMPRIRGWLSDRLPRGHVAGERFELLITALYEACANVAEHGYKLDPARNFELWWVPEPDPGNPEIGVPVASESGLVTRDGYFLIRDQGLPFRADNWKQTDFTDPKVWRRGRGFGLDIIHRAMRDVVYRPGTPEGNITLMTFAPGFGREELRHA